MVKQVDTEQIIMETHECMDWDAKEYANMVRDTCKYSAQKDIPLTAVDSETEILENLPAAEADSETELLEDLPVAAVDSEAEMLEDLQCEGLCLIQKRGGFKFGMDSVLLANFVKTRKHATVVELCSGSGVVSILLAKKTGAQHIIGVEIQDSFVEMANRSVRLNHLESKVQFICQDLRGIVTQQKPGNRQVSKGNVLPVFQNTLTPVGAETVDTVVVNPPYIKQNAGIQNAEISVAIARHEICCTLRDVVKSAAFLLAPGGSLFMVHRPDRLADVFCTFREFDIEPKFVKAVHASYGKRPVLFLICGKKQSGAELRFLKPLYTYDLSGNYITQETLKLLNSEIQ